MIDVYLIKFLIKLSMKINTPERILVNIFLFVYNQTGFCENLFIFKNIHYRYFTFVKNKGKFVISCNQSSLCVLKKSSNERIPNTKQSKFTRPLHQKKFDDGKLLRHLQSKFGSFKKQQQPP